MDTNWEATLNWPVGERPRGLSSTGRKRGIAVLNIPRGETKVVLQQRLKLEGSVTKVTGSLVFLELLIQPLISLTKLT